MQRSVEIFSSGPEENGMITPTTTTGGRFRTRARLRSLLAAAVVPMVFGPAAGRAQVNIEKLRDQDPDRRTASAARIDLTTRSGNVDITTLGLDLRNDTNLAGARTLALARGDFGWKDGERFSNEGLVHFRLARSSDSRWLPEVFAQGDYDKSRRLDRRALVGGGIRAEASRRPGFQLAFGTAWMLESERYELPAGAAHEREPVSHRWSNYVVLRGRFDERVTLTWTAYAQPRFDDFADVRVLSESSLGVALSETLTLTTTFRLRHDGDPPDGIEDLDTRLSTGLAIEL
jgi:hypothetical protein